MFDYRKIKQKHAKVKKFKMKFDISQLQKNPYGFVSRLTFDLLRLVYKVFLSCWLGLFEKIAKEVGFSRPWNIPSKPRKISFTLCGVGNVLIIGGFYKAIIGQTGISMAFFAGALFAIILASWVLRRMQRA